MDSGEGDWSVGLVSESFYGCFDTLTSFLSVRHALELEFKICLVSHCSQFFLKMSPMSVYSNLIHCFINISSTHSSPFLHIQCSMCVLFEPARPM